MNTATPEDATITILESVDPRLLKEFQNQWQSIIDLMADIVQIPAGLIMRLNENRELEVFVSSHTELNPYAVGEKEMMDKSGLYCETVIKSDRLLKIPNALVDEHWKNNPDVKLNMISYLGFPLKWPSGTPFGTICVLDNKENHYNDQQEQLVHKFRDLVEKELSILFKNKQLQHMAESDPLTGILNRSSFIDKCTTEIYRSTRYNHPFSLVMFDLDKFKIINDTYGHICGDTVLMQFVDLVKSQLRPTDLLGRFGGDEFMIALPETTLDAAHTLAARIQKKLTKLKIEYEGNTVPISACVGVSILEAEDNVETMIYKSDIGLYASKNAR